MLCIINRWPVTNTGVMYAKQTEGMQYRCFVMQYKKNMCNTDLMYAKEMSCMLDRRNIMQYRCYVLQYRC